MDTPFKRSADMLNDSSEFAHEELSSLDANEETNPKRQRLDDGTPEDLVDDEMLEDEIVEEKMPEEEMPIDIPSEHVRAYLIYQATLRLEQAKKEGIPLQLLTIGEDCLPVWEGFDWDSEEDTMYPDEQDEQMQRQLDKELSDTLRSEIVTEGNKLLRTAVSLGLSVESLWIGESLLPQWDNLQWGPFARVPFRIPANHPADSGTFLSDEFQGFLVPIDNFFPSDVSSWHSQNRSTPFTTDLESSDNESTFPESELDDVISLRNFVHLDAYYSEDDENEAFDDVGALSTPGAHDQDLEVYIVQDEEVNELPDLELAIEEASFEIYDETDDVVDVEIPDFNPRPFWI